MKGKVGNTIEQGINNIDDLLKKDLESDYCRDSLKSLSPPQTHKLICTQVEIELPC